VTDTVRFTTEGAVGIITLDRPPVNAISAEVVADLELAIAAAEDPQVRAVVVTGSPHFAAGADIKAFKAALDTGADPAAVGAQLSRVLARLERLPKPVFAAIRGFAMGGGMELALACDFRFMSDDARCGQPEIVLGIFPGAGGTQRLPRLIGLAPARDLIYSGRHVGAEEALALGFADAIHPVDDLLPATLEAANALAAGPTVALGLAKHAINDGLGQHMDVALELESAGFVEAFATADAAEGVTAFLEKRPPEFSGS
jgi:enoyl-CoA hydratase/carnithine racemase